MAHLGFRGKLGTANLAPARLGGVLVKVHVATLNRTDCGFRAGKRFIVRFFSGLTKPRAKVLGSEIGGSRRSSRLSRPSRPAIGCFGDSEGRFGAHAE